MPVSSAADGNASLGALLRVLPDTRSDRTLRKISVDEGCSLEFEVTYSATRVRQSSGNRFAAAAASCAHISTQYPLTVPRISAGGGGSQRNISGVLMPSPKIVGMEVGILGVSTKQEENYKNRKRKT